ncbi:MAG: M28 family peptidase [Anaerolineales bacterium]|nr:M28 family peptidase [Anaerolineales bacterium]
MKDKWYLRIAITAALLLLVVAYFLGDGKSDFGNSFNPDRAYRDVITQVEFGPRPSESHAHEQLQIWLKQSLEETGLPVYTQSTNILNHEITNIYAVYESTGAEEWVILAAHYDTRMWADQDPEERNHSVGVPGANDGASGVAVLLEIARVLPQLNIGKNVWLVFFDAEDNGRIPGWEWIMGSTYFAQNLEGTPDQVVVVDMIGDADQNIYYEVSSDSVVREEIWQAADELGYGERFIPQEKFNILDDHRPFLDLGIPAVDIIDFDYPYWHTLEDTVDKVSPDSLEAVGNTLLLWLQK